MDKMVNLWTGWSIYGQDGQWNNQFVDGVTDVQVAAIGMGQAVIRLFCPLLKWTVVIVEMDIGHCRFQIEFIVSNE